MNRKTRPRLRDVVAAEQDREGSAFATGAIDLPAERPHRAGQFADRSCAVAYHRRMKLSLGLDVLAQRAAESVEIAAQRRVTCVEGRAFERVQRSPWLAAAREPGDHRLVHA